MRDLFAWGREAAGQAYFLPDGFGAHIPSCFIVLDVGACFGNM